MTIDTLTDNIFHPGTGTTDTFNYNFEILEAEDLAVYEGAWNGTRFTSVSELVLNVDYTISGVGKTTGGTITLIAGNLASGRALNLGRDEPLLQQVDFKNQRKFAGRKHEKAADHEVKLSQQLFRWFGNAIRLPWWSTVDTVLPEPPDSTDQQMPAWDPATNSMGWIGVGPGTPGIPSDGSVTTPKLADDAVTAAKIAPITATGTTEPRRVEDRFADWVNIKDFGAAGDGVTDDTASMIAAIAAANGSGSNVVRVPYGEYSLKDVPITTTVQIIGDGEGSVLKFENSALAWMFRVNAAGQNFSLKNLTMLTDTGSGQGSFLGIGAAGLVSLDSVSLVESNGAPITWAQFDDLFSGANAICNGVQVTSCKFENMRAMFKANDETCNQYNFTFDGCSFKNSTAISMNTPAGFMSSLTMTGCIFDSEEVETSAIQCDFGDHITITGNTFRGFVFGVNDAVVALENGARNVTVSGNSFEDCQAMCIQMWSECGATISDNQIEGKIYKFKRTVTSGDPTVTVDWTLGSFGEVRVLARGPLTGTGIPIPLTLADYSILGDTVTITNPTYQNDYSIEVQETDRQNFAIHLDDIDNFVGGPRASSITGNRIRGFASGLFVGSQGVNHVVADNVFIDCDTAIEISSTSRTYGKLTGENTVTYCDLAIKADRPMFVGKINFTQSDERINYNTYQPELCQSLYGCVIDGISVSAEAVDFTSVTFTRLFYGSNPDFIDGTFNGYLITDLGRRHFNIGAIRYYDEELAFQQTFGQKTSSTGSITLPEVEYDTGSGQIRWEFGLNFAAGDLFWEITGKLTYVGSFTDANTGIPSDWRPTYQVWGPTYQLTESNYTIRDNADSAVIIDTGVTLAPVAVYTLPDPLPGREYTVIRRNPGGCNIVVANPGTQKIGSGANTTLSLTANTTRVRIFWVDTDRWNYVVEHGTVVES